VQNRDLQLVNDGSFEMTGTASFAGQNGATLTKVAGVPEQEGKQAIRITSAGANGRMATSANVVAGTTYRHRGWCRGDGVAAIPRLNLIGFESIDLGCTAGTSWQYFDVTLKANFTSQIAYININTTIGWTELDNISITKLY
jgi:hypothetical protein